MSFRAGLKGSYFALITLAFAEVFRIVANSIEITGGGLGMLIPMKQTAANFQFGDRRVFYYIMLALTVVSIAIAVWLKASRFGARLAVAHRVGEVPAGEASIAVAASAPHRAEAFAACRFAVDALKRDLPVWKQEIRADGTRRWRDGVAPAIPSAP